MTPSSCILVLGKSLKQLAAAERAVAKHALGQLVKIWDLEVSNGIAVQLVSPLYSFSR